MQNGSYDAMMPTKEHIKIMSEVRFVCENFLKALMNVASTETFRERRLGFILSETQFPSTWIIMREIMKQHRELRFANKLKDDDDEMVMVKTLSFVMDRYYDDTFERLPKRIQAIVSSKM